MTLRYKVLNVTFTFFILWLDFCHNYRNLPAAVSDQITVERIPRKPATSEASATIVVKDTKRLVEIANKSSPSTTPSHTGKKEPTLVIIDTNSILSGEENCLLVRFSWKCGNFRNVFVNYLTWQFDKFLVNVTSSKSVRYLGRGPVPVPSSKSSATSFASVLPVAVPAQGMYPPNMRATITPIPLTGSGAAKSSPIMASSLQPAVPPLLPTLTDDMFVVEAPSFIGKSHLLYVNWNSDWLSSKSYKWRTQWIWGAKCIINTSFIVHRVSS